jgi:hypothetical protein
VNAGCGHLPSAAQPCRARWTQSIIFKVTPRLHRVQLKIALFIFAIGDRSLAVGPVRDDIEWVFGSTLGPVTGCERIFMRLSGRTSVCRNSACPAPYFFAVRTSQKYCSDACAAPAQREFKKNWWAKHGAHWRATRGTKRKQGKKKPRQSQQKSHLRGA